MNSSIIAFLHFAILFVVAFLGGALNSVAGGGSFITFPALILAGVPPLNANTTSTIALLPGTLASIGAYRRELAQQKNGLLMLVGVSLFGGLVGARVLLGTPQATFTRLLPFLLLFATVLFTFGKPISTRLRKAIDRAHLSGAMVNGLVLITQFFTAFYGGFFGGGIGIVMLAMLAVWGLDNINEMNAIKTLLAACINGVAVIAFVLAGTIYWPQAVVMIVGAILGGYGGAASARRINPQRLRTFVSAIAIILTAYFFVTTYL